MSWTQISPIVAFLTGAVLILVSTIRWNRSQRRNRVLPPPSRSCERNRTEAVP